MGGGGTIRGMQISLKMNNRRRERERFKKDGPKWKAEKTTYNVPTISEFKRRELVEKIIRKRKIREAFGYATVVFLTFMVILWMIWVF